MNLLLALALSTPPNILVIILDDLGKNIPDSYGHGDTRWAGTTPNLDGLTSAGFVSYANFTAYPTCAPSRAAFLTGKYGFRTGVTIGPRDGNPNTILGHETVAFHLRAAGYQTALIGKWGVGNDAQGRTPLLHGFDLFIGTVGNLDSHYQYTVSMAWIPWYLTTEPSTEYSTDRWTRRALESLAVLQEPWFLIVSYHDVHGPFEAPPGADPNWPKGMIFDAKVRYLDAAVGQVLSAVDFTDTECAIFSDNGTQGEFALGGRWAGKQSLMEGGIGVPLWTSHPWFSAPADGLRSVVDLGPAILGRVGCSVPDGLDGRVGANPFAYTERAGWLDPTTYEDRDCILNEGYKLIRDHVLGRHELFNLAASWPLDGPDLFDDPLHITPADLMAYADLLGEVEELTGR